ncbi:MAG: Ig-like domain-containing protein [Clostridiales bacterium]|jgi:hypothetical protein|nr:Ig-like domain-containing protein [Clostridiales bacterium]
MRALLERGQTMSFTVESADGGAVFFACDDPAIASVDEQGVVTAMSEGRTRVVARSGGVSAHVGIEVRPSLGDLMKRLTQLAKVHPYARGADDLGAQWRWSENIILPEGSVGKALRFHRPIERCAGFVISIKISPPGKGRADITEQSLGKDWRVFIYSADAGWQRVGSARAANRHDEWSEASHVSFEPRVVEMVTARPPETLRGAFRAAYRLRDILMEEIPNKS